MIPDPSTTTMAIHETFLTFQGEGVHMGRKAFFIRTMGCPVKCSWCDSAGTWHPDYVPKDSNKVSLIELAVSAAASEAPVIVLTGGEPLVQPHISYLAMFIKLLCNGGPKNGRNVTVHVETCGAFLKDPEVFDWVTVSPKWAHLPNADMLRECHEIKLIIDTPTAVSDWILKLESIVELPMQVLAKPIWLHPEHSQRNNPEILNAITTAITNDDTGLLRAGWQLHKLYACDTLDARSRPTVPLGGNPANGY